MQERIKKVIKKMIIILIVGMVYLFWCRVTNIHIPCLFKMRTGLYCPGCGITNVFLELSRLDFREAFDSNPVIFVLLPIWAVVLFSMIRSYILDGEFKANKLQSIIIWLSVCCLVIFCIIRNIRICKNVFYDIVDILKVFLIILQFGFNMLLGVFKINF